QRGGGGLDLGDLAGQLVADGLRHRAGVIGDFVGVVPQYRRGGTGNKRGDVGVRSGRRQRADILLQHGAYLFVRSGFTTTKRTKGGQWKAKLNEGVHSPGAVTAPRPAPGSPPRTTAKSLI